MINYFITFLQHDIECLKKIKSEKTKKIIVLNYKQLCIVVRIENENKNR